MAAIILSMSGADEKFLVGAQAAEFLGVKPATLYAYASRGQIESIPGASGRERCYRLSDLIRLRQSARGVKTQKDSEPVWTGPAIKSAITELREDGHRYRGQNALELAQSGVSFEAAVELLWETGADEQVWQELEPLRMPELSSLVTPDTDCLELLKLLVVSLEMTDPVSRKLNREDIYDTARRLILTMCVSLSLRSGGIEALALSRGGNSNGSGSPRLLANILLMALGGASSNGSELEAHVNAVNFLLVLCADHELNAAALASRIAASCDASIYSCLLSALGSFSGSLSSSASRRTEDIVSASLGFRSARAWLKEYLRQNDTIPGFGSELYSEGDPRARAMLEHALKLKPGNEKLGRLVEIVDCAKEELSLLPNLDVGLAALNYALELPPGSGSTLFAVSRAAGWIAHAIEQKLYGGVIRPRARYIGKTG